MRAAPSSRPLDETAVSLAALRSALRGRYRVKRAIGGGGTAVVFLAVQRSPKRRVALKVLRPFIAAQPQKRARFLKGARAAAQVEHPNLVRMYDVGEAAGFVYCAMEYVKGETVAQQVERWGPRAVWSVNRIIRDAATGVEFAHRRGLVHGNLSPANIIVGSGARVLVMDLGLTVEPGARRFVSPGVVLRSTAYLPPEVVGGGQANRAGDIYALGAIARYAATGAMPRPGETAEEVQREIARIARSREEPPLPPGFWGAVGRWMGDNLYQVLLAVGAAWLFRLAFTERDWFMAGGVAACVAYLVWGHWPRLVGRSEPDGLTRRAAERLDGLSWGMSLALAMSVAFACWLGAVRWVSGPEIFQRMGVTWWGMLEVYWAGFVVLCGGIGALQPYRRRAPAAMAQGFLMALLSTLAVPETMGLSYGRVPSMPGDLVLAAAGSVVLGGLMGFALWRVAVDEERAAGSGKAPA
jgi:hypothetical protein